MQPAVSDTPARPTALPEPSRRAALERIDGVRPAAYARTRNHVDGAVTGLSPYITHGLVTLPEVLGRILQRGSLPIGHKLMFELGWREFFRHAWRQEGDGILASLHPGPLPDDAYDATLPTDIREAATGVPVIDAAVRTLYATGTLHNHARMWLASYVVHLRRVHWRAGADWLLAHLLDGDLASNHLSWQWVAGTGSHKPYLFNSDNVARYAPPDWHSPRSPIDRSYEALDRIARGLDPVPPAVRSAEGGIAEPPLSARPPEDLGLRAPDAAAIDRLRGRTVWLVHPWALRPPPDGLPTDTVRVGVYPCEHHARWPWPESRWRWVDAAMAEVTPERWVVDADGLRAALSGAAHVRSVDDPHGAHWLQGIARLDAAPRLFPAVERRCTSFSQWWTRAIRGLDRAEALL